MSRVLHILWQMRSLVGSALIVTGGLWSAGAWAQQAVGLSSGHGPDAVTLKAFWFVTPSSTTAVDPSIPKPAVVLMHGCGGVYGRNGELATRYTDYVAVLHQQGFHALVLDSLSARGERELCTQKMSSRKVTQTQRRQDALAALAWLAAQPEVDSNKLGLLGWSHGGSTVLAATNETHPEVQNARRRAAFAVAFYPGCSAELQRGYRTRTHLLMLLGGSDDWTPPEPCERLAQAASGLTPQVVSYPGAFHGFDSASALRLRKDVPNGVNPGQGVTVGGNPEAKTQSLQRLGEFLAAQR